MITLVRRLALPRSSTTLVSFSCFFFNDTATTEIYTLSLHDALPIFAGGCAGTGWACAVALPCSAGSFQNRSEEHTSELQSHHDLVCRLLLEKKKRRMDRPRPSTRRLSNSIRRSIRTTWRSARSTRTS